MEAKFLTPEERKNEEEEDEFLTPEERNNPDADIDPTNIKNVPMDTVANKTLQQIYQDDKILFDKVKLDVKTIEEHIKKFSEEEQARAKKKVQILDLSLSDLKDGMDRAVKNNPQNAYCVGRQLAMVKREINHWNSKLTENSSFAQFVLVIDALNSYFSLASIGVDNLDVHLDIWDKLQVFIFKIWQFTVAVIHAIEDFFVELWEGVQSIWKEVKEYFSNL